MCSCHSILECCVMFSGVKLSMGSFVLLLLLLLLKLDYAKFGVSMVIVFQTLLKKNPSWSRLMTGKTVIFPGKSGAIVPNFHWKHRSSPFTNP